MKGLHIIDRLSEKAINKGIIKSEQKEWFCYGIEKRLSSLVIGTPCFLLAVIVSDFWGALAFNLSFFLVRQYSNGVHANSVVQCLCCSLLCEMLFLGVLYPLLNHAAVLTLIALSLVIIISLAPYNHPNFHYTTEELTACKKHARINTAVLSAIALAGLAFKMTAVSKGISLGCAMAGFSLCFAYLFDRRTSYGKQENETEHNSKQGCKRHDGL